MEINPMLGFSLSNFDFLVGAINFNAHQKFTSYENLFI